MSANTSSIPMPEHRLFESPNSRSIEVGPWFIIASTNPISNAPDCDALSASLGIPIPEMTFGSNFLTLEHRPSGYRYTFNAEEALRGVKVGELGEGDGGVKVGYAEKWLQSSLRIHILFIDEHSPPTIHETFDLVYLGIHDRTDPSSEYPMPRTVPTKLYDWTYTTTYTGHQLTQPVSPSKSNNSMDDFSASSPPIPEVVKWFPADPADPAQAIPLAELSRPDPILFYAEIPLYEDELHDNGSSTLLVRIRVMPKCFFILSRFSLRVDGVLFRVFDTRMYHSFSSNPPSLIKETSGWEAPYDRVRQRLPKRNDLTPLTDPTWIAKILAEYPQKEGAKTGWRGLSTRREVAVLKHSEV